MRGGETKQISLQSLQSAEIESVSSFKSSPPLPTVDLLPEIIVEGEMFLYGCVFVCVCVFVFVCDYVWHVFWAGLTNSGVASCVACLRVMWCHAHQPFDINDVEWCTWCGEHEPCVVMHTHRQGPPRLRVPRSRRYVEGLGFRCRVQVHGLGRVSLSCPVLASSGCHRLIK